jgi:hypothetical protein
MSCTGHITNWRQDAFEKLKKIHVFSKHSSTDICWLWKDAFKGFTGRPLPKMAWLPLPLLLQGLWSCIYTYFRWYVPTLFHKFNLDLFPPVLHRSVSPSMSVFVSCTVTWFFFFWQRKKLKVVSYAAFQNNLLWIILLFFLYNSR